MRNWRENLPPKHRLHSEALRQAHASNELSLLVSLHMWYWYTDLELLSTTIKIDSFVDRDISASQWKHRCSQQYVQDVESMALALGQIANNAPSSSAVGDAHVGIWLAQGVKCLWQCIEDEELRQISREDGIEYLKIMLHFLKKPAQIFSSVSSVVRQNTNTPIMLTSGRANTTTEIIKAWRSA